MTGVMEKLREMLFGEQNGFDAALVTSEISRRYLTGFPATEGLLLVTKKDAYFLLDFRYAEAARRSVDNAQVVLFSKASETLDGLIRKHGLKKIAMEREKLTLSEYDLYRDILSRAGADAVADETLDNALVSLRIVKTPEEIVKMKAAQKLTDDAFLHILDYMKAGMTEREVALELEFFMRKNGAEGVAFDFIVVSGTNGSLCHGVPSDKKIQNGEFVTIDMGAKFDGYNADMTRTVAIGEVSEEMKIAYETVLRAQLAAIEAVKAGIKCSEVDRVARDIVEKDYPGAFEHGTGHGVGVEIHERPAFSPRCAEITRPGMVLSVEPGVYLEGKFGLRIEDVVIITETGCEDITKSPKNLIII